MRRSYRTGLRVAVMQWRLVAVVFLLSFLGGLMFVGCSWVALASVLDRSLATRTLLTSLNLNVFVDIMAHHRGAVRFLGGAAVALAAALSFVWIWMNASVVAAVTANRSTLRNSLSGGAERFWVFTRLWLLAMFSHAIVVVTTYFAWRALSRWTADSANEMVSYWVLGGCVFVCALALVTIATAHDHARIRCAETADGAGRCMLWAWAYVLRERRCLPLSWLLIATLGMVWILYQVVAEVVPATSAIGLTLSFLWAQTFMAFRALLRVWTFAAVASLQARADQT